MNGQDGSGNPLVVRLIDQEFDVLHGDIKELSALIHRMIYALLLVLGGIGADVGIGFYELVGAPRRPSGNDVAMIITKGDGNDFCIDKAEEKRAWLALYESVR